METRVFHADRNVREYFVGLQVLVSTSHPPPPPRSLLSYESPIEEADARAGTRSGSGGSTIDFVPFLVSVRASQPLSAAERNQFRECVRGEPAGMGKNYSKAGGFALQQVSHPECSLDRCPATLCHVYFLLLFCADGLFCCGMQGLESRLEQLVDTCWLGFCLTKQWCFFYFLTARDYPYT